MFEPALRHSCAASFAQEIEEQRGHFYLVGISVNDGMAQLGPQLVDLGIGFEYCRHDFLHLAESFWLGLTFPARYAQAGVPVCLFPPFHFGKGSCSDAMA
ncbi:MAG: hypothetical protein JOZ29_01510 [Deltaproteobacteria bacterium]|nr:hypothetical protein [Deltaproteobacteria bacterium]